MIDILLVLLIIYLVALVPIGLGLFLIGLKAPGSWDVWYWKIPDLIFCYLFALYWIPHSVVYEIQVWNYQRKKKDE